MKQKKLFTRRRSLYLGLGSLAGIGALTSGKFINGFDKSLVLANENRSFIVRDTTPLRKRAARKGLIYGADCGTLNLHSYPELQIALVTECNMLALGFLKWDLLRPTPYSFNFTRGDWYAKFAQKNGLLLRGHTLVWHQALPRWFEETVNQQNCEQLLQEHIQRVVGHYAGRMHSWDVVNEAINVEDGLPNGLRKSPWLEFLGTDYIDKAFRLAAQADPKAMLVYNDFGLEYDKPEDEAKRNAVLKLLERLKSQGTPIHAFGMQSHLFGDETHFNPEKLRTFFRDVASLGLKIMITELDVIDRGLPLDIAVRDRIVASVYEDYLSVALDEPAVIGVTNWGLSDRHTWLSQFYLRADQAPARPLPLDDQMQRKLAWNAMARAFDFARRR
ncbi:endo-1,4-beta-xylanase [Nodularia harveyana UHCC-0300]|uniref:Beta-xylanase n=1 Tax=Nodularia harveyana UHCC-0300 TaxID=2974287 RepID=A0ABU5UBB6_9CYAN|nr:endo-1,4-beta-xylanase [Nodularia harveyana]MEA5580251.1 endo-1,4-beta-xylanase [Nodularia harveyana UHCC-0300]